MKKKGNIIFLFKDGKVEEYNIFSSASVFEYKSKIKNEIKKNNYNIYFSNCNKENFINSNNIFFFKGDCDNLERIFLGNFFFFTEKTLDLKNCINVFINKFN